MINFGASLPESNLINTLNNMQSILWELILVISFVTGDDKDLSSLINRVHKLVICLTWKANTKWVLLTTTHVHQENCYHAVENNERKWKLDRIILF